MTLLLGPPGGGKTTLLQTLAGKLRSGSGLKACLHAWLSCSLCSAVAPRKMHRL